MSEAIKILEKLGEDLANTFVPDSYEGYLESLEERVKAETMSEIGRIILDTIGKEGK